MKIRLGWIFIGCLLAIPVTGTQFYQKYKPSEDWKQSTGGLTVHMEELGVDWVIDSDEYVVGVMASVLKPDTHEETMKTMAVILKTYIDYMAANGKSLESRWLGQMWLSAGERQAKGMDEATLRKAVEETGEYRILYDGKPILPLYFALSNGSSRKFVDIWGWDIPYLTSVDSPWDKSSINYMEQRVLKWDRIIAGLEEAKAEPLQWKQLSEGMVQIVEKDEAGYVKQIQVGGETYEGEDFRCRLGLPSACFDYLIRKDGIEFTCYGRGHGVGLSLYGANAMAEEGKNWKEIISWYFPGTSV
ncbi:MAG: SpoIID/LytB domain-containing protein [Clostridia bacterium]|nr:SpoIID/LytB domain-containing protein [Lachnospiraceae bacterium]NCC00332.1 SpoIID/LytB domain-containing protein [Clostridia bacterium]NCD02976.1 SpoIID/LytB domain-containing protein [Clostridia bacterium]